MTRMNNVLRRYGLAVVAVPLALLAACGPKTGVKQTPEEPVEAAQPVRPERPALPEPYATRTLRTRSNIRAEPTTGAEIVTTQPAGATVGFLDLDRGWYKVLVADSLIGWVYAPLVNLTPDDRWMAAISRAKESWNAGDLFTAIYRDERVLHVSLDIAWRDMTAARKEALVDRVGESWRTATAQLGMDPPPEIKFMSNNDVEMATWHGFWGTRIKH